MIQVRTSNGYVYSYNPIDNSIVDGVCKNTYAIKMKFKPLEKIIKLSNVTSFTIGVTEQCNLRCSYCCYSGKYPEHRKHSVQKLDSADIPLILDFINKNSSEEQITVDFYGGESLLEFEWIREFVDTATTASDKDWRFEISTNGLILKPNLVDWLVRHDFNIFVSIDGTGDFHDNCRKDIHGNRTFLKIYENLTCIRERYVNYWINNVHLMMTVQDISSFPIIAQQWVLNPMLKEKMPYRISEVSTVYNKNTQKVDAAELSKYMRLVEWYKDHPDNGVMKNFFTIWLAEWVERPIIKLDQEVEYPTCVPHNRKLYIDASGNIGLCERIADTIRMGSVTSGIDYKKVNEVAETTAAFVDDNCSKCEIARICDLCPDVLKISKELIDTYCHNQKVMQIIKFRCFCELAESDLI